MASINSAAIVVCAVEPEPLETFQIGPILWSRSKPSKGGLYREPCKSTIGLFSKRPSLASSMINPASGGIKNIYRILTNKIYIQTGVCLSLGYI